MHAKHLWALDRQSLLDVLSVLFIVEFSRVW
jgi:hypothetical protein